MEMKKTILALAAFVLMAAPSFGWGREGHEAIAKIADAHLSPSAKKKIEKYLDNHSIVYWAKWMDDYRRTKEYGFTTKWHVLSVDENLAYVPDEQDGDAVYGINQAVGILKNYKDHPDSTVTVNLKYIIHLVGDMHCPSHTGYPDQPAYKGYNIYRSGKKTGFHKFWDASPAYLHKGWTCEDFHRNLDKMKRKQIAKIVEGTAEDWARQNGAEMREVYKLIPRDAEYTQLPEQDRQRAVEICEQQMLRGAYRLAHVLNEIFQK